MLKPDFGDVHRRIEWNGERIAYVRHLAEDKGMTARAIAVDIGLSPNQKARIFELCKRCDIALAGQAGRPRQAPADASIFSVGVVGTNIEVLNRVAKRHSMPRGRAAESLLNAALETGEQFCVNLLDLEGGQ